MDIFAYVLDDTLQSLGEHFQPLPKSILLNGELIVKTVFPCRLGEFLSSTTDFNFTYLWHYKGKNAQSP